MEDGKWLISDLIKLGGKWMRPGKGERGGSVLLSERAGPQGSRRNQERGKALLKRLSNSSE